MGDVRLKQIPLNQQIEYADFFWLVKELHIKRNRLTLVICRKDEPDVYREFYERWKWLEQAEDASEQMFEDAARDNPANFDVAFTAAIEGVELESNGYSCEHWTTIEEVDRETFGQIPYDLDPEAYWCIYKADFKLNKKAETALSGCRELTLTISAGPRALPLRKEFEVIAGLEEMALPFTDPDTGDNYVLKIADVERVDATDLWIGSGKEQAGGRLPSFMDVYMLPPHGFTMFYRVDPPLPEGYEIHLEDLSKQEPLRRKDGGQDEVCMGLAFLPDKKKWPQQPGMCAVTSRLHYEQADSVKWRMELKKIPYPPFTVCLIDIPFL